MAKEVKTARAAALSVGIFMMTGAAGAAPVFLGPTPYLNFPDSPFSSGSFSYFHPDNFESGALSEPGFSKLGVALNPGTLVLAPGAQTYSVDGDNGSIDSSGILERSLYNGSGLSLFRFIFNAGTLGGVLPTHAGIVWTDIGITSTIQGIGPVVFEAFDSVSASLRTTGPLTLGGVSTFGATAEDRFFGVSNPAGFSAIEIRGAGSTDSQVAHLQFGAVNAIPGLGTYLLAITGLATLPFVRRRRLGPVPFE